MVVPGIKNVPHKRSWVSTLERLYKKKKKKKKKKIEPARQTECFSYLTFTKFVQMVP